MIYVIFSLGTGILAGIAAILSAQRELKYLFYTLVAIIVLEIVLFTVAGAQGGEVKKNLEAIVLSFVVPTCIGGITGLYRWFANNR
jgi:hypothetical protein